MDAQYFKSKAHGAERRIVKRIGLTVKQLEALQICMGACLADMDNNPGGDSYHSGIEDQIKSIARKAGVERINL